MGAKAFITVATLEHASLLAPLLRPADKLELEALGHRDPLVVLEHGVKHSAVCYTLFFGIEPAAMFGVEVGKKMHDDGLRYDCAWFLTGRAVDKNRLGFIRVAALMQRYFLSRFDNLYNWVDERYTGAIWLLRHLGVELSEPMPHGVNGEPFRFGLQRRHHV